MAGPDLGELSGLIDRLSDGIMLFDADLRVRAFNRAYERIFELAPGELSPGDTLETVLTVLARRGMLGDSPTGSREEIARRVASWRSAGNRHEKRRLRNGRMIETFRHDTADGGMVAVHVEITGQAERERELEHQRALMQSILANITDGVALVDENMRYIAFNDRFLELFRIPRNAVRWGIHFGELAQHFGDLKNLPEERRKVEIDRRYRFVSDPSRTRVVRSLFDGQTVEVFKALLPGGGCVLTMRDITTELRRRLEVEEARRRAEESSRQKSSFVAHLSHEMRNSLNGILGVVALLDRSAMGERERGQLELIAASGRTLLRLIDDALDLSRMEAETADLQVERFSICELLDETVALVEPAARAKGLEILRRGEGLPLPPLLGDPVRIKQVVLNLLTNAVKFTDAGHVAVALEAELGAAEAALSITVADTGVGIPAEQREAIFREFYQLRHKGGRPSGGVGLGLAICHRLVKAMGGSIAVAAGEPRGTRFTVSLSLPLAGDEPG